MNIPTWTSIWCARIAIFHVCDDTLQRTVIYKNKNEQKEYHYVVVFSVHIKYLGELYQMYTRLGGFKTPGSMIPYSYDLRCEIL